MRDNKVCRLDDIWIHTKEKESNTRLKIELFIISSDTEMGNIESNVRCVAGSNPGKIKQICLNENWTLSPSVVGLQLVTLSE